MLHLENTCEFKRETLAQVFSCELCEIFKNTFFIPRLWWLLLEFYWRFDLYSFIVNFYFLYKIIFFLSNIMAWNFSGFTIILLSLKHLIARLHSDSKRCLNFKCYLRRQSTYYRLQNCWHFQYKFFFDKNKGYENIRLPRLKT